MNLLKGIFDRGASGGCVARLVLQSSFGIGERYMHVHGDAFVWNPDITTLDPNIMPLNLNLWNRMFIELNRRVANDSPMTNSSAIIVVAHWLLDKETIDNTTIKP